MHAAPGPVSRLSTIPGVDWLTILWIPPSKPNGVIVDYEFCSNSSSDEFFSPCINISATHYTLRDLPPNTVFAFNVRAYTIIGPGENVTGHASTSKECEYS